MAAEAEHGQGDECVGLCESEGVDAAPPGLGDPLVEGIIGLGLLADGGPCLAAHL